MNLKPNIPAVCAAFVCALVSLPASGQVLPPVLAESFNPSTAVLGATSTLTITVSNPSATSTLSSVFFNDTFPAGLVLTATGTQTAACSAGSAFGGVAATAGGTTVALLSTVLPANGFCTFTVSVKGTAPGLLTNNVTVFDGTAGAGNTASAGLSVSSGLPPVLTKTFGSATVAVNSTTTLTFVLSNPNAALQLNGVGVSDTLPVGLLVATPSVVATDCAVPVSALAGSNLISVAGVTLAPSAACTVTVSVVGVLDGQQNNTTAPITSANGGTGLAASAGIFVGDPYQVRYTANLTIGDSVMNFTNTGESSTTSLPAQNGNICVNAYAFSPDEQLISCCSCAITPDGLGSISAANDLVSNGLTPGRATSVVVKLLATSGGANTTCNAATAGTSANPLANGLVAWGTTIHALPLSPQSSYRAYGVTETRFASAQLSAAELVRVTALCGFIQINGSGYGICRSCRLGGLGAARQ